MLGYGVIMNGINSVLCSQEATPSKKQVWEESRSMGRPPAQSPPPRRPAPQSPQAQSPVSRPARSQPEEIVAPREQDVVIGRGFMQQMKRGLGGQSPKSNNMVDVEAVAASVENGGSVWTLQKGFEGIFGHLATSKEEVLRRRGPQMAIEYEAVPGDEIDQRVEFFSRKLKKEVAGGMSIFRISKGEYEIDGNRVHLEWGSRKRANGTTGREIYVTPITESGDDDVPDKAREPLAYYLGHAANVGHALRTGGGALSQVPDHVRMSFNTPGVDIQNGDSTNRYTAMQLAAEQAKMREHMAQEWRSRNLNSVPEDAELKRSESPDVRAMEKIRSHLMVSPDKARSAKESPMKPRGLRGEQPPMMQTPPPAAAMPQAFMPQGAVPQFTSMYHQPAVQLQPQFASMYHSYGGQLSPEFGSMYMAYR
mmetsp:Transcript_66968/g.160413  ORF Transcript_66968/g.160413 Transcript_66968/m.160413 type:complete len:422 (-) Transcript_66968:238-1503(-)